MQETTFFPGSQRRVTIGSPTKQCSNGRITFPIAMPLNEDSLIGIPEWVDNGFRAVSQSFTEVEPEVQQVSDIMVAFWGSEPEGLFTMPAAKISAAELKGFVIKRVGETDNPEVELQFKVFCAFARDIWAYLGEMAGEKVYMGFPNSMSGKVTVVKSEKLPLDAVEDPPATDMPKDPTMTEALGPEFEDQVRKSMGAPKKSEQIRMVSVRPPKSGPKDLAAFHAGQAASSKPKIH